MEKLKSQLQYLWEAVDEFLWSVGAFVVIIAILTILTGALKAISMSN